MWAHQHQAGTRAGLPVPRAASHRNAGPQRGRCGAAARRDDRRRAQRRNPLTAARAAVDGRGVAGAASSADRDVFKSEVPLPVSEEVRRPVLETAELLRSLGHEVVEPVLAKPPIRVGHFESLGPTRAMARILACMPFTPPQNFTGQPAMSVPTGASADGLPEAVHLVGRPHDAATLVSLAAQLESARPWAHHRPRRIAHQLRVEL
jgi:Asp-tRNA(Asn)/Glu-tRNA(Gln) amidotransferase A subunit family amidase